MRIKTVARGSKLGRRLLLAISALVPGARIRNPATGLTRRRRRWHGRPNRCGHAPV